VSGVTNHAHTAVLMQLDVHALRHIVLHSEGAFPVSPGILRRLLMISFVSTADDKREMMQIYVLSLGV
jgi:hypothetical protein